MAIDLAGLRLLIRLREAARIPDRAAVVEIGAQQLDNSFLSARSEIAKLGELFGVTRPTTLPDPLPTGTTESGTEHLPEAAPLARGFWEWLGCDYAAIDINGGPETVPLDLNYDEVPAASRAKYDIVTNFGTTEHVTNQLNAFKIIHDLARPGGMMIHALPTQGNINHGLVNYTPKFFWMLARSNDYRWHYFDYKIGTGFYDRLPQNVVDTVVEYESSIVERGQAYRLDDASLTVALQKCSDEGFVAPLDVSTGSTTTSEVLAERYWTVLRRRK